nr:hypothetical protein [Paracoccaceae bacterium]
MVLGGGTFADRAEVDQAHDLQRAARNAEWNVPEGRIGGVIRQLRARGAEAQRRAWWLLVFLIIVIFAGLGFYLGLPFFQQFADGRKQTLDIQIDDITLRITEQDNLRDTLRDEVAAFLEGKPDLLRAQTGEILNPPVLIGDTVFVTGFGGTILTLAPDGTGLMERQAQTGEGLGPPVLIGDTVFVTGWDGTILTLAPDGTGLTERRAQTGWDLNPPVRIGDTVFVTGSRGTILTLAPDGSGLTERRVQTGEQLNPPVLIGDTVFVTGSRGTILTLAPDGSGLTE